MFGLTEFNIFKKKRGWVINLVTGKNNATVLRGVRHYKTKDAAYTAAERLWKNLEQNEKVNALPVRYADLA